MVDENAEVDKEDESVGSLKSNAAQRLGVVSENPEH